MSSLSILIPARNEQFLNQTLESIFKNMRGNTEVIVVLDGQWPVEPIADHPKLTVVYLHKSVGQRAATNIAARLSTAKYVMKIDAHCSVDEGFDVKMMEEMHDDWTMIPAMYNLHAFDWVCVGNTDSDGCGHKIYQGPTPEKCPECGGKMEKKMVWKPRLNRRSEFYRFDKTLHFQYHGERKRHPDAQGDIAETMSAQGSCFMLTREKYWELDICDEGHGGWGQQGTEVACKTWLSGGRLVTNKKTWYAHMFRTQGGDFGFPYPLSGGEVDRARQYSKNLWLNDSWPKAKYPLSWLIEKFSPLPDWHNDTKTARKLTKGIVYYTDNKAPKLLSEAVRKQILKGMKEKHIVSISLEPIEFGKNIVLNQERGYLTMAKQILAGLEASDADVIFFCEHDIFYDPSHFDFSPEREGVVYYNTNVWQVRAEDGHALYMDDCRKLSQLCAYRTTLIEHYKKRIAKLTAAHVRMSINGNDKEFSSYVRRMGFEPGTHNRTERVDDLKSEARQSKIPSLDIRHSGNLTPSRWRKDQYRNQKYTRGWKESSVNEIDGWQHLRLDTFID
jgi:glycosyltransferase involved in cell wall biosynthesis